jgi:hypothetical protein
METVLSHIVRRHLSQVNEDVATDALAYILDKSGAARAGMSKLLSSLAGTPAELRFEVQWAEPGMRPDMCGISAAGPCAYVENKFWAGLTDNQPVNYLRQLEQCAQPTVLLVVAPGARQETLWRELTRRSTDMGIALLDGPHPGAPNGVRLARTDSGPVLALTSWDILLSLLEHECLDDLSTRADLAQLRALCVGADTDAFVPVTGAELTDQRTPALLLQLGGLVQEVVQAAITAGALSTSGLRPQATWFRTGRYVRVAPPGAWVGTHLILWRAHGVTPLWLHFPRGDFGRADEVHQLLGVWADAAGVPVVRTENGVAVALEVPPRQEMPAVVRTIVENLQSLATALAALPEKVGTENMPPIDDDVPS